MSKLVLRYRAESGASGLPAGLMDNSTRQVQTTPPKPRRLIDNAAEVRRRKEAAERLIKERHEALRRQHEEKIHKINEERQRQQRELKERHAKELKRQQDVLQRRMALMERDKARKQEILEKNHAVASRLSTNSSRKNYAFGSSTPRELSFLDSRLLRMNAMEKRSPPEKPSPPNGAVNARRGRSMASVLSASMYASSNPDRARHTASTTRLSQPKSNQSKVNNPMTQSVYHSSPNPSTPVSRLRKKPLNQVTTSVPNTPLTGSTSSPIARKVPPKPKPRGAPVNAVTKKPSTPPAEQAGVVSSQRRESLARSEDIPTPLGITASEPPRSENSFTSDEIPLDMAEKEAHEISTDSLVAEVHHNNDTIEEIAKENSYQSPSEREETTLVNEVDVVIETPDAVTNHAEQSSEEEAALEMITKDVIVAGATSVPDEQLISPVPKSSEVDNLPMAQIASPAAPPTHAEKEGTSLADELAGVFGDQPIAAAPTTVREQTEEVEQPSSVVEVVENIRTVTPVDHPANDVASQKEVFETLTPEKVIGSPPTEKPAEDISVEKPVEKSPVQKLPESPPVEKHDEKVSFENPLIDFTTDEKERTNSPPNVANKDHVHDEHVVNHVRSNGIEQQHPPVISVDLPGTVPAKDVDESVMKKVPTPPNEFIAHRLRREQEQREIDERKARIAAILAKSRNLSSGALPGAGRISPPSGETAQDVLKRLASNGNLPALQKLVARRTPEPPTIDQIAAEDPAPQAI
ncbi:hypothetical protein RB195_007766 [Necator americanus]